MSWLRKRLPDWALIVIIVVAVVAIAVSVIAVSISSLFAQDREARDFSGPPYPYIARIKVIGEIGGFSNRFASSDTSYHHRWTIQTIDTLIGDAQNKGICLWLDTPGGTVYESDELYLKLMEYKEKTGRPIYSYMRRIAASGGYYVAASSDEIFANRNAWTGSIGVSLGTFFDFSEFLEEHGIRTETITSGSNKAMGNNYEPLTGEQRDIFQSLVDDAYDRFVEIVAEGRGMTDQEARKLADGRLYTAAQALDAELIDGIFGEKEAEAEIQSKFDGWITIFDCYYKPDTNYFTLFSSVFGERQGFLEFLLGGFGSGGYGSEGYGSGGYGSGAGGSDGTFSRGDVAAVLELAREQEETGAPPLKYLYTG